MSDRELIESMKRLKVQTGSLACLGCAHEDNCGIHGCAILRVETLIGADVPGTLVELMATPAET